VFGALISVETESQLLDPPQSLKLGRIDQANHQASFGVCIAQRNDVVNRISIDSWGQVLLGPYSIDGFCSLPHDAGQGGPKRPALALGIVSDSAIPLLRLTPRHVVGFINSDINPNFRFDFKVEDAPTQQRLQSVGEETKA